jgi:uncharacterized membrane protein
VDEQLWVVDFISQLYLSKPGCARSKGVFGRPHRPVVLGLGMKHTCSEAGREFQVIWFRVRHRVRGVLTSFWFWPLVMMVFAWYLSGAVATVTRRLSVGDPGFASGLTAGAKLYSGAILTTTAAADVTILTFVFSTFMVVLQLAGNQLSPRILRTTVREGRAQMTMAVMVGGFVFSLRSLAEVYGERQPLVAAALALIAMGWTVLIVLAFLYFVGDTVARVRAPAVIRAIGSTTAEGLRRERALHTPAASATEPDYGVVKELRSVRGGVLTGIGWHELVRWARRRDALVELDVGLGDHVSPGVVIGRVRSESELPTASAVPRALVLEPERTLRGDTPYGFRLLVDIANRSLSPAINDPTTASQVLDELEDLLVQMAGRPGGQGRFYDDAGVLRLTTPTLAWNDLLLLAVEEIYEYGRSSSQVTRRISRMLDDLASVTSDGRLAAVREMRDRIEVVPPLIRTGGAEG